MSTIKYLHFKHIVDMCLSYSEESINKELIKSYSELNESKQPLIKAAAKQKIEVINYIIENRFIL